MNSGRLVPERADRVQLPDGAKNIRRRPPKLRSAAWLPAMVTSAAPHAIAELVGIMCHRGSRKSTGREHQCRTESRFRIGVVRASTPVIEPAGPRRSRGSPSGLRHAAISVSSRSSRTTRPLPKSGSYATGARHGAAGRFYPTLPLDRALVEIEGVAKLQRSGIAAGGRVPIAIAAIASKACVDTDPVERLRDPRSRRRRRMKSRKPGKPVPDAACRQPLDLVEDRLAVEIQHIGHEDRVGQPVWCCRARPPDATARGSRRAPSGRRSPPSRRLPASGACPRSRHRDRPAAGYLPDEPDSFDRDPPAIG